MAFGFTPYTVILPVRSFGSFAFVCVINGTLRTEIISFLFVTFTTTLALYRRVFQEHSVQDVTASHLVFNRYFKPYGPASTVTVS